MQKLHGWFYWALNGPNTDFKASIYWLQYDHLLGKTEGFDCNIMDEVIMTDNYRKYIQKYLYRFGWYLSDNSAFEGINHSYYF